MDSPKPFSYFFLLNLNICLGTFIMGYFLTVYNPLQNQLNHIYGWTDSSTKSFYEGLITALIPFGAIIANIFSSKIIEYLGRKTTCIFVDIFCIFSTILTLFAEIPLLIIGRLLCGLAVGVNSVLVGIYVGEISPFAHVHFFGALGGFMLNFGMIGSYLFGMNTLSEDDLDNGVTDNWWKVMFAFPMIICFIRSFMIIFVFNYETPSYLVRKDKKNEALKVLTKLYAEESKVNELYEEIQKREEKRKNEGNQTISMIFTKKYFKRFLIAVVLVFANQFSGINAIAFYSKSLFTNIGGSDSLANYLSMGLGALNLISGLFIAYPLKHIGIRKTYLFSLIGCATSLGLTALFVLLNIKIGSLIFLFAYNCAFSLGVGPIIFMVIPQLLPDKFVSFAFILMWVFAFILGIGFPQMLSSSMDIDGSFLFFACCCIVALIFNYFYLPDTSGKSKEEVVLMFQQDEQKNSLDQGLIVQKTEDIESMKSDKLTKEGSDIQPNLNLSIISS